jgi:hypothetical protein
MKKEEYIVCSAIKRLIPRKCKPYHNNNDICNIELGLRHHDIFQRYIGEVSKRPCDQGFFTSHGRFVGRKEAYIIAYNVGQVTEKPSETRLLFSEDLY